MNRRRTVGATDIPRGTLACCIAGALAMWVGGSYAVGPAIRLVLHGVVSTARAMGAP